MKTAARDISFDFVSGIMILWVIILHIAQHLNCEWKPVWWFIDFLYFAMPWFFFRSGYFHKSGYSVPKCLHFSYKKILQPYIVFALLGTVLCLPLYLVNNPQSALGTIMAILKQLYSKGAPFGNLPLWFMLSLFTTKILFVIIENFRILWIIMLFPITGYILSAHITGSCFGLNAVPAGITFYFYGYIYRRKILVLTNKAQIGLHVVMGIILIFGLYWDFSWVDIHYNSVIRGDYIPWLVNTILALSVTVFVSRKFILIRRFPFFEYLGRHSMIFFVLHWPLLYIDHYLITDILSLSSLANYLLVSVAVLAIPYFLNEYMGPRMRAYLKLPHK